MLRVSKKPIRLFVGQQCCAHGGMLLVECCDFKVVFHILYRGRIQMCLLMKQY